MIPAAAPVAAVKNVWLILREKKTKAAPSDVIVKRKREARKACIAAPRDKNHCICTTPVKTSARLPKTFICKAQSIYPMPEWAKMFLRARVGRFLLLTPSDIKRIV